MAEIEAEGGLVFLSGRVCEKNFKSPLFEGSFWISFVVVVLFHPVISHYNAIHLFNIKIFPLGSQSEGHHSAPVGSQGHLHQERIQQQGQTVRRGFSLITPTV